MYIFVAPPLMANTTNIDVQQRITQIKTHLRTGDRKAAATGYAYFVKCYSQNIIDTTVFFYTFIIIKKTNKRDCIYNEFRRQHIGCKASPHPQTPPHHNRATKKHDVLKNFSFLM